MPSKTRSDRFFKSSLQVALGAFVFAASITHPQHLTAQQPAPGALGPVVDIRRALIDHREEMRGLIQRISSYARLQKPGFMVVARDAEELIIKRNLQDEKVISPARTFMRSVDGIMFDGVYSGYEKVGAPPPPDVQSYLMKRIDRAQRSGINILTIEFATEPKQIDSIYRKSNQKGIVGFVANQPTSDLTDIPPYPKRPNNENSNNILALKDVKNYAYLSDPAAFGRQDQFALQIHGTNFDLIIVDPFSGREPLSKAAVETLKYKKLGARRLVFARMDISTAASYRYYWKPEWKEGNPRWIASPYPGDPDRYFVEYWKPEWQDVIFGNPQSYLYGLIAQGYDGVLLEGMRSYLVFEGNIEIEKQFAPLVPHILN